VSGKRRGEIPKTKDEDESGKYDGRRVRKSGITTGDRET
jgi:hypothetical protein